MIAMILAGDKIKQAIIDRSIGIEPFIEKNIKGASYTFTLDGRILFFKKDQVLKVGEKSQYEEVELPAEGLRLEPGQFVLGFTKEKLSLKGNYGCLLSSRGSCAQVGLNVLLSSDFAEPDTDSVQTLEILNSSELPIVLFPNMPIVKGVFLPLEK